MKDFCAFFSLRKSTTTKLRLPNILSFGILAVIAIVIVPFHHFFFLFTITILQTFHVYTNECIFVTSANCMPSCHSISFRLDALTCCLNSIFYVESQMHATSLEKRKREKERKRNEIARNTTIHVSIILSSNLCVPF